MSHHHPNPCFLRPRRGGLSILLLALLGGLWVQPVDAADCCCPVAINAGVSNVGIGFDAYDCCGVKTTGTITFYYDEWVATYECCHPSTCDTSLVPPVWPCGAPAWSDYLQWNGGWSGTISCGCPPKPWHADPIGIGPAYGECVCDESGCTVRSVP